MSKHAIAIGVDGCPAGWFFVRCRNGVFDFGVTADLTSLLDSDFPLSMAVDMPIGLREHRAAVRACDRDARTLLGEKRSSVFNPPLRGALTQDNHASASAWQKKRCGKGLSVQSFNIANKIAEVDNLLQSNAAAREAIFEAHPELCFCALNKGKPVLEKKKTAAGLSARMKLLKKNLPEAGQIYAQALAAHRRKDVARDDIVDALVTLQVARLPENKTLSVPLIPEHDARGLPMRITFAATAALKVRITAKLGKPEPI